MNYLKSTPLISLALLTGVAFAYDNFIIHPKLSNVAIEIFDQTHNRKLSTEEQRWIVAGAMAEDADPRYVNHFYDPTTGEGLSGGFFTGLPAKEWAQNQNTASFSATSGDYSESAILSNYRKGDLERAYQGVGHMLHLVQDMSVPAHTRNDGHPKGDPYEEWAAKNGVARAPSIPPVLSSGLNQAFDELAKYSHDNFFSKDTIIIKDSLRRENGYIICSDSNGVLFKCAKEVVEPQKISYYVDDAVSSDYWNLLSPKAIAYSAGVIEYFQNKFDAIDAEEKVEQELTLLQKTLNVINNTTQTTKYVFGDAIIAARIRGAVVGESVTQGVNTITPVFSTVMEWTNNPIGFTSHLIARYTSPIVLGALAVPTDGNTASVILATQPQQPEAPSLIVLHQPAPPTISQQDASVSEGAGLLPSSNPLTSAAPQAPNSTQIVRNNIDEQTTSVPLPMVNTSSGGGGGGGGASPAPADRTPPVITILGANPATSTVGAAYVDPGATAYDDIDGVRTVIATSTVDSMVSGNYAITYTASDLAGNVATAIRVVTIVPLPIIDTTPPTITLRGENPDSIILGNEYVDPGVIVNDDIDKSPSLTASSTIDSTKVGSYDILYRATDTAGNIATTSRIVNVISGFETPTKPLYSDLNNNGIADADEDEVVVKNSATLLAGEYTFNNLVITNGAVLTTAGSSTAASTFKGVKIFATNLTIATSSRITADTRGYDSSGIGPGTNPSSMKGASYGGVGGRSEEKYLYGSPFEPIDLGSGGRGCCVWYLNGGGAIRLVVAGILLNDGLISSSGVETGSGGSIYVSAGTLAGIGTFAANGGYGGSYMGEGAGGGGRIAAYYRNSNFSGKAEASGGHFNNGGTSTYAQSGSVAFIDQPKNNITISGTFIIKKEHNPPVFNQITVTSGSVTLESGVVLKAQSVNIKKGSSFTVGEGARLETSELLVDDHSTLSGGEEGSVVAKTFSITGSSVVTTKEGRILHISADNLTLEKGSSISVNQKGKRKWLGTGGSQYAGASYGGIGLWNTASSTYGSKAEPIDFGSGGTYRGIGGGAVRITVADTFENNGVVSSNGGDVSSGGSIYVTTNKLLGNGSFSADGGPSYWSGRYYGMGGGGRIAVYYTTSLFSGTTQANGACATFDSWNKTCSGGGTVVVSDVLPRRLSSEKAITSFSLLVATSTISGVVDEAAHIINVSVPFGTDVTALAPIIEVSSFATSTPASGTLVDFSKPVVYTITAENGTTQTYSVTVTIEPDPTPPPVLSSLKSISHFTITMASTTFIGVIDGVAHTINVSVPFGTDVTALVPIIEVSPFATSTPATLVMQNFTTPVAYTITAEDGTTQVYVVTIIIEPDTTPPSVSSYTFNGVAGDLSVDFATTTPTAILALVASENVNWMSVTIEDQSDSTKYKRFLSGSGCEDGATSCSKTWDGILSGGELAPSGKYRIKAHIKDAAGNEFNDYLSPHIIVVERYAPPSEPDI